MDPRVRSTDLRVRSIERGLLVLLLAVAAAALPAVAGAQQASGGAPGAPREAPGATLVLALDNSGSMRANDPGGLVKTAVNALIGQLPDDHAVGVVLFDERARVLAPVRPLGGPGVRDDLRSSVEGISFRGRWTNIPEGLASALYEVTHAGGPLDRRAVLIVTDGVIDTGEESKDQAVERWMRDELLRDAVRNDVRVHGVAMTEAADYRLLQSAAVATGAEYWRVLSAEDLPAIFEDIDRALEPPPPEPVVPPEEELAAATARPETDPGSGATGGGAIAREGAGDATTTAATPDGQGLPSWLLPLLVLAVIAALASAVVAVVLVVRHRSPAAGPAPAAPTEVPEPGTWLHDAQTGESFPLESAVTTLGRSPGNDIVLDSGTVSSFHARIEYRHGVFYVRDLDSLNGTHLNGELVKGEHVLRHGDVVGFHDRELTFRRGGPEAGSDPWDTGRRTMVIEMFEPDPCPGHPKSPGIHPCERCERRFCADCLAERDGDRALCKECAG